MDRGFYLSKKKKKIFSLPQGKSCEKDLPIYLRYCVFIREIWVPLRNELGRDWSLGPLYSYGVMTIGDVHSTVGTLWLTLHHPLQQSPNSHHYCPPEFSLRDLFFSSPPPLDARNRFADGSIGNEITYLWSDARGKPRYFCQVFPSNFKSRPICLFLLQFPTKFQDTLKGKTILWTCFTNV